MLAAPNLDVLTRMLRREQELVERLVYATTAAQLLLVAGESRFLTLASDELHDLLDAVAAVELARAAALAGVARELGLDEDVTLATLAAALPPEQAQQLVALGDQLREAVAGLQALGTVGVQLAEHGLERVREVVDRVNDASLAEAYGRREALYGAPAVWAAPPPSVFDGVA